MRAGCVIAALTGACSFSTSVPELHALGDADVDAPPMIDAYVPDAPAMCPSVTPPTCVTGSNILRECQVVGQMAVDTACAWGCIAGSPHHCGKLVPSGGALVTADLDPTGGLQDKTIVVANANVTINTSDGSISNVRAAGTGIIDGIDFNVVGGVGIFRFNKLALQTFDGSPVRVTGANALALVSITTIDIERTIIQLSGDCVGTNAGPGGKPGGNANVAAGGNGGGGAGGSFNGNDCGGGGGGGFGKPGGGGGRPNGKPAAPGGAAFGMTTLATLTGGGGGGGGGGKGSGGPGGGGGGAIQLASNGPTKLTGFGVYAGITAGGCGGKGATSKDAGGGGGAGGAVLIEAPSITLSNAGVAVNGGGGGGGDVGKPGANGGFTVSPAAGGAATGGGTGAPGGAAGNLAGGNGGASRNAGGGGGAVGWIRMNTVNGAVSMQNASFTSPSFNDNGTTATRGTAVVQ